MDKKRSGKQNPRTYTSGKDRYQNQDKHRWRKVLVWLMPLLFSVSLTLAVITHDSWLVWFWIATAMTAVGYALFLLEWYIWKSNPARFRARVAFGIISTLLVVAGFIWQRQLPRQMSRFPAAVEFVFGSSNRDMHPRFWFAIGGMIYPVHTVLFIRVVNNGPPAMIQFPEVQARNKKGEWVKLIVIPYPQEGYGAFYRAFDGDISKARKWTAPSFEPLITNRVIPSHDVVRGWAYFEVPEDLEIERGTKLRIQIKDVAGDESLQEVIAEESTLLVPMDSSDERYDLTRYDKHYWSDHSFGTDTEPPPVAPTPTSTNGRNPN